MMAGQFCRLLAPPALLLVAALDLSAVEVHLEFGALERMLSKQVFTQDGRKYVKGSQKTPCNFAYLEHPQFQGKDGKLVIRARFSGRSSLNMFGQCVGLGDAFTVVITAAPVFQQGAVALAGVTAVRWQDRLLHPPRVYCAFRQPGARLPLPAGGRSATRARRPRHAAGLPARAAPVPRARNPRQQRCAGAGGGFRADCELFLVTIIINALARLLVLATTRKGTARVV